MDQKAIYDLLAEKLGAGALGFHDGRRRALRRRSTPAASPRPARSCATTRAWTSTS